MNIISTHSYWGLGPLLRRGVASAGTTTVGMITIPLRIATPGGRTKYSDSHGYFSRKQLERTAKGWPVIDQSLIKPTDRRKRSSWSLGPQRSHVRQELSTWFYPFKNKWLKWSHWPCHNDADRALIFDFAHLMLPILAIGFYYDTRSTIWDKINSLNYLL